MTWLDLRLASRNVFRQGLRSMMPILVVTLSCYVIILVGGLYQYLFDSLEQSVIRSEGHFKIEAPGFTENQISGFVTENLIAKLKSLKEVRVLAIRSPISGIIGFGEQSSVFSGQVIDPYAEQVMQKWPNNIGIKEREDDQKASIGSLLALGLGVKVGDWISGISGYESFAVEIGEILTTDSEESDRFFLRLPYRALGGINYRTVRSVHVQINDPAKLADIIQEVQFIFNEVGIKNIKITEYTSPEGYISSVQRIYGDNLRFIMIVLFVTVFFSIATTFTLSLTERIQELGTMRAFGAKSSHLEVLFHLEALYLSLYGFVLGTIGSLLTGVVINWTGGIKLPPPPTVHTAIKVGFSFNSIYLLSAFVLVLMVGQLSAFVVTRKIGQLTIIEQLRINT
ncbi:FtsX-like permease family protein [Treponema sp. J25]|uniref:ABC transporter permease n=1 Tax=Treponema sp. J25 TaxID=2094121 RepID=UPI00104E4E0F|nr:FtsX-like permease family protein [Treponema sp. J25]MCX7656076.1 FtsX-like permease family protein [Treponemataceae bacterium]TCW60252.1 hypothetical protein C5O22_12455 [Treponema sp. J25]